MSLGLRQWQIEAYEKFIENDCQGVIKVATGKGKTRFAIHCIQELKKIHENLRTCIVVPTIDLMYQWRRELVSQGVYFHEIGFYYGEEKQADRNIVIFVQNSASTYLNDVHFSNCFDFMIADECHHYGTTNANEIFKNNIPFRLGLSATPERHNDPEGTKRIEDGIGPIIYKRSHFDDPDEVPPLIINSIFVELTDKESNEHNELTNYINGLNYKIEKITSGRIKRIHKDYLEKIQKLAKSEESPGYSEANTLMGLWTKRLDILYKAENKMSLIKKLVDIELDNKIIIFNERIDFCEDLKEMLEITYSHIPDFKVFMLHSKLSGRDWILSQFNKASRGVLIAPRLIDEGVDVPDASTAIISAFSGSPRQTIQRFGRILRNSPGKDLATIYYLVIDEIEEKKYFYVLKKSDYLDLAKRGEWLTYKNGKLKNNSLYKMSINKDHEYNETPRDQSFEQIDKFDEEDLNKKYILYIELKEKQSNFTGSKYRKSIYETIMNFIETNQLDLSNKEGNENTFDYLTKLTDPKYPVHNFSQELYNFLKEELLKNNLKPYYGHFQNEELDKLLDNPEDNGSNGSEDVGLVNGQSGCFEKIKYSNESQKHEIDTQTAKQDRLGYDENWCDPNGFLWNGIHKDTGTEYNLEGYDQKGYDRYGFNKENKHKHTNENYDLFHRTREQCIEDEEKLLREYNLKNNDQ